MTSTGNTFTINILDAAAILRKDLRSLCIYAGIFGLVGIVIAFTSPVKYKSSVVLAPEESGSGFTGSISSIAAMVGMDLRLGQTGDAIYPEIYPELMESTDFIVGLFDTMVTTDKTGEKFTYYDYLDKHQKTSLAGYPAKLISDIIEKLSDSKTESKTHDSYRLTKHEFSILKQVRKNIRCGVDKKTNVITITVTDQDPLIAATMASTAMAHLQNAITEYRTKKACVDLQYIESLHEEAKADYEKARKEYAASSDDNMNTVFMSYKIIQKDKENDMMLRYNIYSTLSEQLQLAKAKVQERTPAFTIVQNASVPVRHSSISKKMTLALWIVFGLCVRSCMILWKNRSKFISKSCI